MTLPLIWGGGGGEEKKRKKANKIGCYLDVKVKIIEALAFLFRTGVRYNSLL